MEVHESFCGSFHRFHGSFHSFHERFHGRYGSFHGSPPPEASTESTTEASASMKLPRKLSRKLPRKLPRKCFHGFESFHESKFDGSKRQLPRKVGSSAASRKLPRNLFAKAFDVVSTKGWKLHPRNFTVYLHGSFRSFHGISAASTTAPTDIFALYTNLPPVEPTTCSTTWLTLTLCTRRRGFHRTLVGCCVSLGYGYG